LSHNLWKSFQNIFADAGVSELLFIMIEHHHSIPQFLANFLFREIPAAWSRCFNHIIAVGTKAALELGATQEPMSLNDIRTIRL
jgi:hypothetical protein